MLELTAFCRLEAANIKCTEISYPTSPNLSHYYNAKADLCDRFCLSVRLSVILYVTVSRIAHDRVY